MGTIAQQIFDMAQELAWETPGFQTHRAPGNEAGNGMTKEFLQSLNDQVHGHWPKKVCLQEPIAEGVARYSFDYFIPSEETAVEIALSIWHSPSEFEKDIFKAILAKNAGMRLRKLVLIGKKDSERCRNAPGPKAIRCWVWRKCGIEVEVKDLTSDERIGQ